MPDYPKTTGELVTVKDSKDGQTKLLDTLIQLLRQADADTIQSLNDLIQTVSSLSGIAWKNNQSNLPATNNTYDIGSLSQMIKHIYSMGMTLGVEGEDWEINDNDGYVTLNNEIQLRWGILSLSKAGLQYVSFNPPFSKLFCITYGLISLTAALIQDEGMNLYNPSETGFYLGRYWADSSKQCYWIAIGKT